MLIVKEILEPNPINRAVEDMETNLITISINI